METISLEIKNISDNTRRDEPLSIGIPLPEGQVSNVGQLTLKDGHHSIPAQFKPLCYWPDKTVKWALMDSQLSAQATSISNYYIERSVTPENNNFSGMHVEKKEGTFLINTGATVFSLKKGRIFPFTEVKNLDQDTQTLKSSELVLVGEDNTTLFPVVERFSVETKGPLRSTLKIEGTFRKGGDMSLSFISRIHFFYNKSIAKIEFTLWNKNPARHSCGLWDLGDPGSNLFKSLFFKFELLPELSWEKQIRVNENQDFEKVNSDRITIYQDSSGGEHWNSTNHINREQHIPLSFKGYKVYENDVVIDEGLRSTPIVCLRNSRKCMSATVQNFWQNFPKSISARQNEIIVQLFPDQFADLHELQGGERKTHSLYIDFSGVPDALSYVEQPLQCILSREWYAKTAAIAYLGKEDTIVDQPYRNLLATAVSGGHSFFAGREKN